MARVEVDKTQHFTVHPWGRGNATINGVQWGTIANNTNSVDEALFTGIDAQPFNVIPHDYPGGRGKFAEGQLAVGVTFAFKSDNGDCIITYKLQGRELINGPTDKPWVDLSAELVQTRPVNAAWGENTLIGYLNPQANFNAIPLELRIAIKANTNSNSTADIVMAKFKNSSYVDCVYTID